MNLIKEKNGIALFEDSETGLYHVVELDETRGQVKSIMASDMPKTGCWFGRNTDSGIKYVSKGRSWAGALSGWKRCIYFEKHWND